MSLFSGERSILPLVTSSGALGECPADRGRLVARRRPVPNAAFFAFAFRPRGFESASLPVIGSALAADPGEYVLNWDDVCRALDSFRAAVDFGLSGIRHACVVCGWDRVLAASAEGVTQPVI